MLPHELSDGHALCLRWGGSRILEGGGGVNSVLKSNTGGKANNDFWKHHQVSILANENNKQWVS